MWTLSAEDFSKVESWGLENNPFAAVEDFSYVKCEQRWLNPEQQEIYVDYVRRRNEYIQTEDFDVYYRDAEKPIDKDRWEYLMQRKAWYIMPLGWENIAINGGVVADLGCGDGDTVQRIIEFIDRYWESNNIVDKKLHIVGIDLNQSRIVNANNLVTSDNPNITFEFFVGDLVKSKLDYGDNCFDYSLCCGVLEILNDEQYNSFMDEMARVTKSGIYVEDLFEQFPGGHPRDSLGRGFCDRSFCVTQRQVVLSEPFSKTALQDPKKLWPMLLVQNLWAESQ